MSNSFHLVQELISLQVTLDIYHVIKLLKEEKESNLKWAKDQTVLGLEMLTDYISKDKVWIHEIKG